MNKEAIGSKIWKTALSFLIAILALIPIVWMIALSLKHQGTAFNGVSSYFIPPYTFENYIKLTFGSKIMMWMLNSVFVAVITTFFTIVFTAMAAFALSRIRFRLSKFMYTLFIIGLLIPTFRV
jgi:multiple sugar transport system permease protein